MHLAIGCCVFRDNTAMLAQLIAWDPRCKALIATFVANFSTALPFNLKGKLSPGNPYQLQALPGFGLIVPPRVSDSMLSWLCTNVAPPCTSDDMLLVGDFAAARILLAAELGVSLPVID
jgi:hypothetical protein